MAKRKVASKSQLDRIAANINSLVENDKFVVSQFEKLHDEVESLRNDVHEMKDKTVRMSLQLNDVEKDVKTVKRVVQEEPEKRRSLESRIRQVLPNLPT